MNDEFTFDELGLGERIRQLTDLQIRERNAADVVRHAIAARRSRARWPIFSLLPVSALAVTLLAVGLFAVGFVGDDRGSRLATARVNGLEYGVGIARSMDLSLARLTPVGLSVQDGGFRTQSDTAYQVDDVDSSKVLVLKLVPGQTDDAGSVGHYLLLVRGKDGYLLTCPYFPKDDPLRPTVCR